MKGRATVRLSILALAGHPYLKVILADFPRSHLGGAHRHHPVWQFQSLKNVFRILEHLGVQSRRFSDVVSTNDVLLYLPELMNPNQSARVSARAPGLSSETGRYGSIPKRQLACVKDFIGVKGIRHDFRSTCQVHLVIRNRIGLVFSGWKMTGAYKRKFARK